MKQYKALEAQQSEVTDSLICVVQAYNGYNIWGKRVDIHITYTICINTQNTIKYNT